MHRAVLSWVVMTTSLYKYIPLNCHLKALTSEKVHVMVKKALQDFLLPATPALHRPVSNTVLHVNGSVRCTGIMQSSLNNTDMFNAELCLIIVNIETECAWKQTRP